MTGVKSGGDDDIAALLQVRPQEDAAGVDVNGAGHLLLQGVHPVVPVQLHLGRDHDGQKDSPDGQCIGDHLVGSDCKD